MAVLPNEGAYETTFYSKMRRFASQADVTRPFSLITRRSRSPRLLAHFPPSRPSNPNSVAIVCAQAQVQKSRF